MKILQLSARYYLYKKRVVVRNKLNLLLKIVLNNTRTLQQIKFNHESNEIIY